MKTQVKDLKKGNIFTESGITNIIVDLTYDKYVNGTDICTITTKVLKFNKKYFGYTEPTEQDKKGFGYYTKKLTTNISIK